MRDKLVVGWKKVQHHRVFTTLISLSALLVLLVILGGYKFNWDWTGFNGSNKSRTLWDWMQLLIVPIVLALGATLFNRAITHNEQNIADQRYINEQNIALDKQREDLLQVYLDRMSDLLLNGGLSQSSPDAQVRNIARVRTVTVLRQLDTRRINYVLSFLRETKLVTPEPETNIISFRSADLSRVDFKNVNLSDFDLSKANLSKADLTGANICKTNLSEANLNGANMSDTYIYFSKFNGASLNKAHFQKAYLDHVSFAGSLLHTSLDNANFSKAQFHHVDLSRTTLEETDLSGAWFSDTTNFSESVFFGASLRGARLTNAHLNEVDFTKADLREVSLAGAKLNKADLHEANLSGVNLAYADFNNANLSKTDLTYAKFSGVNFDGANLSDAIVSVDRLKEQAKSLKGATMPDGSIHP